MTRITELGTAPSPDITLGETARTRLLGNPDDAAVAADQVAVTAVIDGIEDHAAAVGASALDINMEPPTDDVVARDEDGATGDVDANNADGGMPVEEIAAVPPEETGVTGRLGVLDFLLARDRRPSHLPIGIRDFDRRKSRRSDKTSLAASDFLRSAI